MLFRSLKESAARRNARRLDSPAVASRRQQTSAFAAPNAQPRLLDRAGEVVGALRFAAEARTTLKGTDSNHATAPTSATLFPETSQNRENVVASLREASEHGQDSRRLPSDMCVLTLLSRESAQGGKIDVPHRPVSLVLPEIGRSPSDSATERPKEE